MVNFNPNSRFFYKSALFNIKVRPDKESVKINMQLLIPFVSTKHLPNTLSVLRRTLPGVLRTECFNYKNQSFKKEVQHTEIGHLFEHILLEYLLVEKTKIEYGEIVFNGRTRWNWVKNPYGSFEIEVDVKRKDIAIFIYALKKSINLTQYIIRKDYKIQKEDKGKLQINY